MEVLGGSLNILCLLQGSGHDIEEMIVDAKQQRCHEQLNGCDSTRCVAVVCLRK